MACGRCNDTGWVCEEHSNEPWGHGCGAAGEPCELCYPNDTKPPVEAGYESHISEEDRRSVLPAERGSIRKVTIAGDPVTYHCEVRTLPGSGLRPGDLVWVEFGGYWSEVKGKKTRQRGQWRRCRVLPNAASTAADVHVRLDDLPPLPSMFG